MLGRLRFGGRCGSSRGLPNHAEEVLQDDALIGRCGVVNACGRHSATTFRRSAIPVQLVQGLQGSCTCWHAGTACLEDTAVVVHTSCRLRMTRRRRCTEHQLENPRRVHIRSARAALDELFVEEQQGGFRGGQGLGGDGLQAHGLRPATTMLQANRGHEDMDHSMERTSKMDHTECLHIIGCDH